MYGTKRRSMRLLSGTIVLIALIASPGAMASVLKHHHGHGHGHGHSLHQSANKGHGARSHGLRYANHTTGQRAHVRMASWGPRSTYSEREAQRREEAERSRYAALVTRREQRLAGDQREAPITAKLNLDQLSIGRERDAEIAKWEAQYGTAARGG